MINKLNLVCSEVENHILISLCINVLNVTHQFPRIENSWCHYNLCVNELFLPPNKLLTFSGSFSSKYLIIERDNSIAVHNCGYVAEVYSLIIT